jgi:2-polyprenyl-3-methyl-5-hydroxy-6-metoxy-1,4-benzoquinol methylase
MEKQFQHPMLPQASHDELARQKFIESMKKYIFNQITPGNRLVYEKIAKPKFETIHQRSPQNRFEIKEFMQQESYYQWWGALMRINQEMLWESVNTSVERQLPELIDCAKDKEGGLGSLTVDPNFKIPAYQTAVDIHCMPGSYHSEFVENDVAAGATYDRGVYLYGLGWLGPLNDDMGLSIVENYLKPQYPDFQPKKILDIGCSVGHSTLPYADAYPNAEVSAIDVSAPMLRYGHARAEVMGKPVHFYQQNAEHTNFDSESFDLIVSHILLHEIPVTAIRNVMEECYRLLTPGGMMIHLEAPLYKHMDLFSQFMYDWQTANNNEPFWTAMRDLDLEKVVLSAGFGANKVIQTFIPNGAWKDKIATTNSQDGELGNRGTWFIVAATK